jgi:thiopeptide-type bacteriocin biosynthesis protein
MVAAPRDFRPVGFVVVRSPVLAFDELARLGANLRAPAAHAADVAEAAAADRATVTLRLKEIVRRPEVRDALFCASPTLDEAVAAWLVDAESSRAANVSSAVWRYVTRMAARATPFGLFSSTRLARIVDGPARLSLGSSSDLIRHTRIDMQYLGALVETLEHDRALRAELRHRPSSSLYRAGDQVHFAEAGIGDSGMRRIRLISVDWTDALAAALETARAGALPEEIAAAVAKRADAVAEEAEDFVHELIDSQLLVSELQPPLTGVEPLEHVIPVLGATKSGSRVASTLASVTDALAAIDRRGMGVDRASYEAVAREVETLPAPVDIARLYQVDLVGPPDDIGLPSRVVDEIARATALITRIAHRFERPELAEFCRAFRARYEMREVPLCEALDHEIGVGFGWLSTVPSQLLEGITLEQQGGWTTIPFAERDALVMKRLAERTASATWRWELDDADVAALESRPPLQPPDSFAAAITLAATNTSALERGDFAVHVRAASPAHLGRFCHADPALRAALSELLRAEERLHPGVIFAEIVHLPEGRAGNVLCRPILRSHEIPYMGVSGIDPDKQIQLDDLLVSVRGDRVRLRSRRLGCLVEPRLTTAHTAANTLLGPYRFLCAMRHQDRSSWADWDWGIFEQLPHLPRVSSGRAVLALEQWNLGPEELASLRRAKECDRYSAVVELRERWSLPRWIAYQDESGHNLAVDLDNALACDSFVQIVRGKPRAKLFELFPAPQELVAEGPEGRHVTELIVPFITTRAPSPAARPPVAPRIVRTFAPGSEWLYAKIYSGRATADALLADLVAPLVENATRSGVVDRWFFSRFEDPEPHLRLRLHGSPTQMMELVLPELERARRAHGSRDLRVVLDTYDREIERYGGDVGIDLAESLFCADSQAVLDAIVGPSGPSDPGTRWRLALLGLHRLLVDLGLDLQNRADLTRGLRASFGAEFMGGRNLEHRIAARYRVLRDDIAPLLEGTIPATDEAMLRASAAFAERGTKLVPIVRGLEEASASGQLTRDPVELAAAWLHMHANRMLVADHRAQELVLYDFLARSYASQMARAKRASGEARGSSRNPWT